MLKALQLLFGGCSLQQLFYGFLVILIITLSLKISEIIKEPFGGAHRNKDHIIVYTRKVLIKYLEEFKKFSRGEILEQRKEKFLKIGKQKTFKPFSIPYDSIRRDHLISSLNSILLKYKKQFIVVALVILATFIFLL